MSATGIGGNAKVIFDAHNAVDKGGVLFALPALLVMGLLKTEELYKLPSNHYYGLPHIVLTLAFMALLRIKNPEQLKQCKPGELGKVMGLDRVPEVRCLRQKINLLSQQKHAQELNRKLADHWNTLFPEDDLFLYIDGHVRVYSGELANLPVKYISRQKLCLNATTEYWVNDKTGQPVLVVMGELTEKLQHAIESQIIPQLKQTTLLPAVKKEQTPGDQPPACTLVFDREAYDIGFFDRLMKQHNIAILTYRKNVKDRWAENLFKTLDITVLEQKVTMRICEKRTVLDGVAFREIRRLNEGGHQTSIITNHPGLSMEMAAGRMFARWSQENFFRYMITDYDFDKMVEYGTEKIDEQKEVVNPPYRKISHRLKKHREKTRRLEAKATQIIEQIIDAPLDKMQELEQKQTALYEQIEENRQHEIEIIAEREKIPARIKLKDMPDDSRYNKLKTESKLLMNCIKMICYRAETAIANSLTDNSISSEQKRMLVKQIMSNNADIMPDTQNQTLTITLHTLSTPRFNIAAQKLANLLNQTNTVFPNTNLRMIFKTSSS